MENYQNNNRERRSVNTNGGRFRNSNTATPFGLDVIYWDDKVKLSFIPELPQNQQTESRRYDYDNTVSTVVVRSKCHELYRQYKERIIPAIKECREDAISIPIADVNQLQVAVDIVDGVPSTRITLIKDISAQTLTAQEDNIITYTFNRGEYILGFNPKTGQYKERVFTYNEIDLFMNDLHSFVGAGSNSYVHTNRVVDKYWKDSIDTKLNRIGEKNGLDLSYKPRYGTNGNGGQGSIFDSKPTNPMESQTISSMDDIDAVLNMG